ncbi:RWD domain-containing protein [Durotheca rogersii]|uniref:RWD domain-containing protein n=1 Tax=Durotheca rogersii TaxID=419775 RepID=UPI00221F8D32|nr:RWD domain-containing protein [Durotheca rogersii]KAI5865446.1 RWD domain-containing protein [Durotheca rogersii]
MAEEDIREVEISTINAIYPELQVDDHDPHTVSVELPVSLAKPVTVLFPATADGAPPVEPARSQQAPVEPAVDSHALSNLPSLQVRITLPDGYPQKKPPKVSLSTSPPWLSGRTLRKLEGDVETLWEEFGRDQVIFTYIDNLQQSIGDVFGLVDAQGCLEVSPEHKLAILDYDIKAKQAAFEKETFGCGICLDPKKGRVCHRMLDCGHVFCVKCLQDFYNNAIAEGDVASVQCLEPKCAKRREDAVRGSVKKKAKTHISPSELLQIPLEQDTVKRYVMLKYKTELESDKNTVYCPRSWCQGAARSKKHKKPKELEFVEASDEESNTEDDAEENNDKAKSNSSSQDLLAICDDCGFAFCIRCGQSWHGEFKYCIPKERKDEITEEEKASLDYMRMHTTPCPTCAAPCQKTHGCNHMRCFRCQTHFCYLCSAWLDPSNPYRHFNVQPSGEVNGCFMRLWELEGGDGIDVGNGFEGGGGVLGANAAQQRLGPAGDLVEDSGDESDEADPEVVPADARHQRPQVRPRQPRPPRIQPGERVAVEREGPLVLRIEGNAPPAQARAVNPPAPPAARPAGGVPGPRREAAHAVNAGQRRGRGNRGGRGQGVNRQNNRNRPQGEQQPQQNQPLNNNGRNVQDRMGGGEALGGDGQLDARQEAWIRQFVQLALNDQEDLVEWDSEDD